MDPLVMVGAWAGAILGVAGVTRLAIALFVRAVEAALDTTLESIRQDLEGMEDWWVERLEKIEDRLDGIDRELRPNGGASLRDTVDRLEKWTTGRA